jgi:hypothetical protein
MPNYFIDKRKDYDMITFTIFGLGLATGMLATYITYCIWVICMWIINGKRGI